jgi:c-di-GMP-related signal transduction protein
MAALAIASQMNSSRSAEILHTALVRARFCETAAPVCQLNTAEQYLLGLMSLFPAMLRAPMDEIAPMLPLRKEIREALSGMALPERTVLTWIESHERGNWPASDAVVQSSGLNGDQMARFYVEAVRWADVVLHEAA